MKKIKLAIIYTLMGIVCYEAGLLVGMIKLKNYMEDIDQKLSIYESKRSLERLRYSHQIEEKIKTIDNLIKTPVTITQGVNRAQLRGIIRNVLVYLGEKDLKWVDLLMITSQIESDLGYYFKQVRGPAVGIFQMEPETEKSIWKHYLRYQPKFQKKIAKLRISTKIGNHEMEYNVAYATAMAYTLYRWRKVNPSKMGVTEMVKSYKKFYNTNCGKSTFEKSMKKILGSNILG